jgi:L-malate glycosyltransferase
VKKILFVSDAKSVHTRRWAEHFRDMGCDVHVASFRPEIISGVRVHLIGGPALGKMGYVLAPRQLRRLFKDLQPDLVHAQYVTSYGFLAAWAGLHPLVVTAWGTDVLISPRSSRIKRWLASYAVRHADAVTTVAEHMNPAVAELGVEVSSVVAVPFGVDTARFLLAPTVPRLPLRVICTRNFAPVYSVSTLVEAVAMCRARGIDLRLDLVGAGPLEAQLTRQAESLGLQEFVTFHGHVSHDRLANLLAAAHVFVSPALSDGNNVSLNEAMASGCFPICTAIAANEQWISDGDNGLLYVPGSAEALAECLGKVAADPSWIERVKIPNRRLTEARASWQAGVERMLGVYSTVQRDGGAAA